MAEWIETPTGIMAYIRPQLASDNRPVAFFDFDGTLVPFRGRCAWPDEFVDLFLPRIADDFHVVVVSNRATGKTRAAQAAPVSAFLERVPCVDALLACAHTRARKPLTGLWEYYQSRVGVFGGVRRAGSFVCGDAAGRPGDFAASDCRFASNIGLRFVTPEMVARFGPGPVVPPDLRADEIRTALAAARARSYEPLLRELEAIPRPVLVVLTGSPGGGKTSLAVQIGRTLGPCVIVSRDIHGGKLIDGVSLGATAVATGRSAVVDNTSPSRADRAVWIEAAHAANARAVAVHLTTGPEMARHLDAARCELGIKERTLPRVAFHVYRKKLVAPCLDEGLDHIFSTPLALGPSVSRGVADFLY